MLSLLFWQWPLDGKLVYPFKLLATWLHEGSHALVMIATGAGFSHMEIFPDTAGLAFQAHGVSQAGQALISSAGYMGTPLFGCFLLLGSRTVNGARRGVVVLTILMAVSGLFALSNDFGKWFALCGTIVFALIALFGRSWGARIAATIIGIQCCINALLDIRVLFRNQMVVNGKAISRSDADLMAESTFGSPKMWATIWLGWSLVCLYVALRQLSQPKPASPQQTSPADATADSAAPPSPPA